MNSFSNMASSTKTFSTAFETKRDADTVIAYNNKIKDSVNSLDGNLFEKTYLVEETIELPGIDYDANENTQKEIVIESNKTNIVAQDGVDINNATMYNPIFRNGELRDEERPHRVREEDEVAVVEAGGETQTDFEQIATEEEEKNVKKEAKEMLNDRVEETEKPIDLEHTKKVDVDGHLYKQQTEKTHKIQYDLNEFEGKNKEENDPKKRMFVAPIMTQEIENVQTNPVPQRESVEEVRTNRLEENINTRGVVMIPYGDVSVEKIVEMPKELGKYVMLDTSTKVTESVAQPRQSLETLVEKDYNKEGPQIEETFITRIKNVFAPKPQLSQIPEYVNLASNNFGTNIPEVTQATSINPVTQSNPGFKEIAMQNHYASLRGNFDGIYFGEQW